MSASIVAILGMGLSLGFVHALDADHVMAVSALSSARRNSRHIFLRSLRYCGFWALGHGAVLMVAALLLFGLGLGLPVGLQRFAEQSVGLVLIAIGLLLLRQLRQEQLSLHRHNHGDVEHTHLVDHRRQAAHASLPGDSRAHFPALVGVLHGLAGSAPALALVPVASGMGGGWAVAYVAVFSLSVLLGMLAVGAGLGGLQRFLANRGTRLLLWFRRFLALSTVGFGAYWFAQAL
ncbi:MAG: hypothetical protein ACPHN3_03590 [Spongiibacter sp.]